MTIISRFKAFEMIAGAAITLGLLGFSNVSHAQTYPYPSDCLAAGGPNTCVGAPLSPTVYRINDNPPSCDSGAPYPLYKSDDEAKAAWKLDLSRYGCGALSVDMGYYTARALRGFGCGTSGYAQALDGAAREFFNLHQFSVNASTFGSGGSCGSPLPTYYVNAIDLSRTTFCAAGFTQNGVFCESTRPDPGKLLGAPKICCGNPITTNLGNKYQEDIDYQGSGSFPLMLVRYYNSSLDMDSNTDSQGNLMFGANSYYGTGSTSVGGTVRTVADALGGDTYLSSLQAGGTEPVQANVGLSLIGTKWRHGIPPIFLTPRLSGMMISEVSDGKAIIYDGVQARSGQAGTRARRDSEPGGEGSGIASERFAQLGQGCKGQWQAGVSWSRRATSG